MPKFKFIFASLVCCAAAVSAVESKESTRADIIFLGKNIVTVDESLTDVDAVAVRGEEIIAVGASGDILSLQGNGTRIVDLGDNALVPGFIDAHGHISFLARLTKFVNLSSPPVGKVESIEDIQRLLTQRIENSSVPPGSWVTGYGYDDSLIAENRHPTRADLDEVSTEHPIYLMHVSGHLAAVNSAALALGDISNTSENPPGGVIRRRPGTREPNGVLEETAARAFAFLILGSSNDAEKVTLLREAADLHARYGITTVQDGGAALSDIDLYRDAAERQSFPVDIVAFAAAGIFDDQTIGSIKADSGYVGGYRLGGVKFVLDGSPQGRTAYMTRPYDEPAPGAGSDYRGYPSYSVEDYNKEVSQLIRNGVPILTHANGDAAIDIVINAVDSALDEMERMPDHRTVVIHAQLTRDDQIKRYKELGLVPSYYSAHPFFWGDWHRKSFGEERAANISPVGRTLELGVPFTIHNDAPVVPPDIMRLLWITVTRQTRSGHILGPHQRATALQALRAVTLGAAYQYFEEDRKGSISVGKQADLVILGANPLTVNPDDIKDIPILETLSHGKTVYVAE